MNTYLVGDVITLRARHPHGPGKVKVIAIERVMGELRPRCEHIKPHSCLEGLCNTEFFVMSGADVDQRVER